MSAIVVRFALLCACVARSSALPKEKSIHGVLAADSPHVATGAEKLAAPAIAPEIEPVKKEAPRIAIGSGARKQAPPATSSFQDTLASIKQYLHPWLNPLRVGAVLTTVALQLSPMRSTLEIRRDGDVKRYDGYPYFTVLAGATQWCIYGASEAISSGDWTFFTMVQANGPGMIFGVFYISTYFANVSRKDPRDRALRNYLFVGACILLMQFVGLLMFGWKVVVVLGVLGAIGSAQIALSPFKTLPEVLKTRSTRSWPFDLCLWSFIQSAATGGFGFACGDPSIWVPNVIGVIAAGIQLILVAMFNEKTTRPPPKIKSAVIV